MIPRNFHLRRMGCLVALYGAVCSVATRSDAKENISYKSPVDLQKAHSENPRQLHAFTLDNGLQVLIIHDPKVKKSSAAMDIAVGSWADPKEHLGMVHYLEHMLFLGTKKYPKTGDFMAFLDAHQGSYNAVTGSVHTNYYFDVIDESFEQALDRFAQFFIAPLFTEDLMEREKSAVHSEHDKNKLNDGWRKQRIRRLALAKDHPGSWFHTGTKQSLAKVKRQQLVDFYQTYYRGGGMKLALLSSMAPDKLEQMVRKKFAAVPKGDPKVAALPEQLFDKDNLGVLYQIKSLEPRRDLDLIFEVPFSHKYWQSRPGDVLGFIMGHEGRGSLLSYLKSQGLATSLGAGIEDFREQSLLQIQIGLTEKGLKNYDDVIAAFFAFVQVLKTDSYPQYLYHDLKAMAEIEYVYRSVEQGAEVASQYAAMMQDFPADQIDLRTRLYNSHDREIFTKYLAGLSPDKMQAFLVHPEATTDSSESYYGVEYGRKPFSKNQLGQWRASKPRSELSYPRQNPYIPTDLKTFSEKKPSAPQNILGNDRGDFWFEQDRKFQLPKGAIRLRLLSTAVPESAAERLLTTLYALAFREGINEWAYELSQAGLTLELADHDLGLEIFGSGYAQHLPVVIDELVRKLPQLDIDETKFENLRDRYQRELQSSHYEMSVRSAFYEISNILNIQSYHRKHFEQMVADIDFKQVQAFAKKLFEQVAIQGSAYGSFQKADVEKAVTSIHDNLKATPIARKSWPQERVIKLEPGAKVAVIGDTATNNNAWVSMDIYAPLSASSTSFVKIAEAAFCTRFFTDLRTNQQLGYVVGCNSPATKKANGLLYYVQSAHVDSVEIAKKVHIWKEQLLTSLKDFDKKDFAAVQSALIAKWQQPPTTIEERNEDIFYQGVYLGANFNYKSDVIASLQSFNIDSFRKNMQEFLKGQIGFRVSAYINKKDSAAPKPSEKLISDHIEFKQTSAQF